MSSSKQFISIPKWYDLHAHFRQGENTVLYIKDHINMGCEGILAMPNTLPPITSLDECTYKDKETKSIISYKKHLLNSGGNLFKKIIVPLYLTKETTKEMIYKGAKSGLLEACKYYPPHGTTNSSHSIPMNYLLNSDVLKSMEDNNIILCIHGEEHGITDYNYLDKEISAESIFYTQTMPKLIELYPNLKIVCEHISTKEAVNFVTKSPNNISATITPQHLLFTLSNLIRGLNYHLYCLPVIKFQEDKEALNNAIIQNGQTKFFAGTDSAPHFKKVTKCGCAAGCYLGGVAPQLYAKAFENNFIDLFKKNGLELFINFLCLNGPNFYGFKPSNKTFKLVKNTEIDENLLEENKNSKSPISLDKSLNLNLDWKIKL